MDENKKEYKVIGTVTIGTDEYRDLIEAVKDTEIEKQKNWDKYWQYYSKCSELEKKIEKLEQLNDKVAEMSLFINSDDNIKTKFKLWKLEREEENEDE